MPKLYQHQLDETYYTKRNIGYFVTHQIHPDGVAYLKHCGVRLGDEIPPYCISQLEAYGWLFTKDEVPYGGAVDWSPRWASIRPRPLSDLKVFRQVPSVNEWAASGASAPYRSAADQLEAELREMREKGARERDEKMQRLIADIDAKQRATREARSKTTSSAKTMRPAPSAAKAEPASPKTRSEKSATKAATSAGVAGKPPSRAARPPEVSQAGQGQSALAMSATVPSSSTTGALLAELTAALKSGAPSIVDPIPIYQAYVAAKPESDGPIPSVDNRGRSLIASSVTAAGMADASSRPSWIPSAHVDAPQSPGRPNWWEMLVSAASWALPLTFGVLVLVGVIGTFAQWLAAILVGLMFIGKVSALSGHLRRAVLDDVNRIPWSERKSKLLRNPAFQRDRGLFALLLMLLSVFVLSVIRHTDVAWLGFLMVIPAIWAIREVWRDVRA